jgi:Transcriptional Coactivator p15 (PC4)
MDIRTFWMPSPDEPWQPTKKGFRLNVEALDDVKAGIAALEAAVDGTERSSSTWDDAA